MRIVVADAGPINYLIQIEQIDLLPLLFEAVFVPEKVWDELRHGKADAKVRHWVTTPPFWIEISETDSPTDDPAMRRLDDGERAAIQLAVRIAAELVMMDDRAGVAVARGKGFAVTGTLGILDLAARRGLIRLGDAFARLKATNFRYRPELLDALLAEHEMKYKPRT